MTTTPGEVLFVSSLANFNFRFHKDCVMKEYIKMAVLVLVVMAVVNRVPQIKAIVGG